MPSYSRFAAKFRWAYIGLALLALVACAPFDAATPPAGPAPAQTLTLLGGADDPPTLDPALADDVASVQIIRHVFSGLVRLDNNLAVASDLAVALPDISPDGRTYTFHLRHGVQWPDGHALTADDVRYSLERATDPALAPGRAGASLPAALYLSDIAGAPARLGGAPGPLAGVRVVATDTVALTISAPRGYFLQKLASFWVVDRRNVESGGAEWFRHPAGTGPFRLLEWQPGDHIALGPNPTYFGGAPRLSRVTFLLGEAATGGLVQYEQGRIDYVSVPVDDVDRVQDPAGPLSRELQVVPSLSTTYLSFNTTKPPFDDVKVRQAFSLVIDRDKIARVMFNGRVQRAVGLVPAALPGYHSIAAPDFDVAEARRLLAESRYGGPGALPRIAIYAPNGDIGVMLQAVFKQNLGVDVEVRSRDLAPFLAGAQRGDFQAFVMAWEADWPDPSNFLEALFRGGGPENLSHFASAPLDAALDAAGAETDPARRDALYAAAERQALAAAPLVPLLHRVNYALLRSTVRGVTITPIGIIDLRGASIAGGAR
jgi:oligopeptide transport system substrate-binding protein